MNVISVTGYAPNDVNYCPECGAWNFPHTTRHIDGSMKCNECGLICYIVEADDSHGEEDETQCRK